MTPEQQLVNQASQFIAARRSLPPEKVGAHVSLGRPLRGAIFLAVWFLGTVFAVLVGGGFGGLAGMGVAVPLGSFLSFIVAVPSAIKVFNWTATLYRGQIGFEAPMLYSLGFLGLFTIGGLTGLFLASVPIDIAATDSYFVVAHFHTIMVGGTVSAFMAGIHYWWPKVTGRLYHEFAAQLAAIMMFLGFNLTFIPQFIMGWLGMPRRYHVYPDVFQIWHVLSSGGAAILAVAYLLPLGYLSWSLFNGDRAGDNPWEATGLEWQTPSPPPKQNFLRPPRVTSAPYQYHEIGRAREEGEETPVVEQGNAR